MSARLLVVCTANVCRSPTTALLLQEHLAGAGLGHGVDVTTAGTDVWPGSGYCPVVAAEVGPAGDALLDRHAARPLSPGLLAGADLVLVLERRHRAAVASLLPPAGSRTFTLREAAALAGVVGSDGRPWLPSGEGDGGLDLAGAARALHAARGTTAPPPHPRSLGERLRRDDVVDPLDVPDAHVRRSTEHPQVVRLLRLAVDAVAAGLLGPAAGRPGTPA